MPEKCHTIHCAKPAVARGLCQTHYKRLQRHGHVAQTRDGDWGRREQHEAYRAWCGLRRYHSADTSSEWLSDFWAFARDVPPKPAGKSFAARSDEAQPWGSGNFYWRQTRKGVEERAGSAAYMRNWQRAVRAANPDYGKGQFLKRAYGVTLDWYKAKHAEQNGACAICLQSETAVIHGRTIALAVDHCHDTKRVRGLLCRACNNAIGALKHDPVLFNRAIDYLKD